MNRKRRPSDDEFEDDDDLDLDFDDDDDDDGEFEDGLDDEGADQVTEDRPLKSFSDS